MDNKTIHKCSKSMFSSHKPPIMKVEFLRESSLSSSNQLDFHHPQIHSNLNGSSSSNPILTGVRQTSSPTVNFHDNNERKPFVQNGGHENKTIHKRSKSMFSSNNPTIIEFLSESPLSSSNQLDFHHPQIHSNLNGLSSSNPIFNGVRQTSSPTVNFHDNNEPKPFVQNGGHENKTIHKRSKSMFSYHSPPIMKVEFLSESSLSSSNQLDFHHPQTHSNLNGSSSSNPILNGVCQTSSSTVNFQDNNERKPYVQNGGHVQPMFNSFLLHHSPNPIEMMCSNQSQIHFNRAGQGGQKNMNIVNRKWSIKENRLLDRLVDSYGEQKWSQIAQHLPDRLGKQCRDRWKNHLRPDIKKDAWGQEEDKILIQAHTEIGNKWSEISKILPGRTENSIKNHWNATKRKKYSSGNLLQDYIRSLNLDSEGPTTTGAETQGLRLLQLLPEAMDFNQINNQSSVLNYD